MASGAGPLETTLESDFTRFSALRSLTSQTNADRFYTRAQLASPWVWPAGYITPKLQLHATHYSFAENWRGANAASRIVPTFSPVPYTHLTLPKNLRVHIPGGSCASTNTMFNIYHRFYLHS